WLKIKGTHDQEVAAAKHGTGSATRPHVGQRTSRTRYVASIGPSSANAVMKPFWKEATIAPPCVLAIEKASHTIRLKLPIAPTVPSRRKTLRMVAPVLGELLLGHLLEPFGDRHSLRRAVVFNRFD